MITTSDANMFESCKKHLRHVEEPYFHHMCNALSYGFAMIGGGLGAIVHAFLPAFFQTTASDTVARLHAKLQPRAARTKANENAETSGTDL